jgi:hypothetical protein
VRSLFVTTGRLRTKQRKDIMEDLQCRKPVEIF